MAENRGKQFEDCIREALEKVPFTSVDRLHDQTTGYLGSSNICDFIAYQFPRIFYLECKSCHDNTLSINSNNPKHLYGDISNKQWTGLLEKSVFPGVTAGYVIWFINRDKTVFVPATTMQAHKESGHKSWRYDDTGAGVYEIPGKKLRVFFDYDLAEFLGGEYFVTGA